jgi:hypothetical protein
VRFANSHFPESDPSTTHKNAPTPRLQFARSGALLRFFEISVFLSILAGARRAQKRRRDGHTDGRGIHALRGSKHEKGR